MNNKIFVHFDNEELGEEKSIIELKRNIDSYIKNNSNNDILAFMIQSPLLGEDKYIYEYKKGIVLLFPGHKFIFINLDQNDNDKFNEYCDDFIEDLGSLSDKYEYKEKLGRPRAWRDKLICKKSISDMNDISILYESSKFESEEDKRLSELLISLLTGSINDINKIGGITAPTNLLDKVKKKILLFDATQTNFLYQRLDKKRLTIQGLSGTGKTELLLHKLKDLYTLKPETRICFTCHNKVLANKLRERIPSFFNFMKVEQQIEWNKYLWCCNAWGSNNNPNSGAYRYICHFYGIPFFTFSQVSSFEEACHKAINAIKEIKDNKHAFDYMLIDESQDFGDNFIELCELVTKNRIYIAGDIFQNIFDNNDSDKKVDYLLNQCYRTDPKTLMFAHGLSMGLFEEHKLQWPTDEQWNAFGYIIKKESNNEIYNLTRSPIRRFEDIHSSSENSLYIKNSYGKTNKDIAKMIVSSILDIKRNNPTVQPSDISIILMTKNRAYNVEMSHSILNELNIEELNWDINNAFETKEIIDDKIFLTNHNNVKGLEFPFVICVSPFELNDNLTQRNALYMAITRSFIRTDLIMPFKDNVTYENIIKNLITIQDNNCIRTVKPSLNELEEIQNIHLKFTAITNKSYKEIVYSIIDELNPSLSISNKGKIFEVISATGNEIYDISELKSALSPIVSLFEHEK